MRASVGIVNTFLKKNLLLLIIRYFLSVSVQYLLVLTEHAYAKR